MAGATVVPALPALSAQLADGAWSEFLVRQILVLPALATAIASPLVGWWIDRRGLRGALLLSMAVYAFAGSSGLVVDDLGLLLAGRAALGIALAGIMTSATALISDFFEGEARNRVVGLQASVMGLGGVVFLSLGGWLADQHWRAPFGVYALAILVLVFAARAIPEPAFTPASTRGLGPSSGPARAVSSRWSARRDSSRRWSSTASPSSSHTTSRVSTGSAAPESGSPWPR
jgi:MFS family permease